MTGPAPALSVDGILVVCKPVGMTSHDVVDAVRDLAGTRRVGHTGTLDPGAAGVLVLAINRATRVAEFLAEADKTYRVEVTFGRSTDTGDIYGRTVRETHPATVTAEQVEDALPLYLGEIEQVPPMASAVRVGGRRLYELARRGQTVQPPARRVRIYRLELREFIPGDPPRAILDVACSKGTYVRRLCTDLGETLGCGAVASFMVRTRVGRYELAHSHTLEELQEAASGGRLAQLILPVDDALADYPAVDLLPLQRRAAVHGQAIPLFRIPHWQRLAGARVVRLRDSHGLVALARVEDGLLKPFKVLRES
ncbi:MAG: tRNA pseudouridine(55) synthase TruB [Armatimonadota bacterium]|nr:tRNA pseudouridine(55) synthase TruB [Armatimonadota bacterium]MDR7400762.1 tRNA pseudouridine(55) synthase TruB [Armatimonadota bacterium]MDR7404621.1 tRNA pseudouridine(55) synthase TruB [Armatimonadota bacterium]MDR7436644.1 tRNA pseudouridine(55) synthase TruB [Armatimonadota bacterium]MDR7472937.1 tRNA pseudouridine(55) synthase TruB [Armatimonadota bacterium]